MTYPDKKILHKFSKAILTFVNIHLILIESEFNVMPPNVFESVRLQNALLSNNGRKLVRN